MERWSDTLTCGKIFDKVIYLCKPPEFIIKALQPCDAEFLAAIDKEEFPTIEMEKLADALAKLSVHNLLAPEAQKVCGQAARILRGKETGDATRTESD
jgi:hypothetical protein